MKKIAFYTQSEAQEFAIDFAADNNGYVATNTVPAGTESFDTPREINSWSGEIEAYEVLDNNTHEAIAYVAFWE